jgi:hypothetical protein
MAALIAALVGALGIALRIPLLFLISAVVVFVVWLYWQRTYKSRGFK